MPQALAVDWEHVKFLALAIGVRESARQLGISEEAVKKRCTREGWLIKHDHKTDAISHAIAQKRVNQGLSPTVPKPSDVLSDLGRDTRFSLATAANKAAKKLAEMDADKLLLQGQVAVQYTKVAATVHGFGGGDGVSLRLELIARGHGHEASESGPAIDGSITVERETDESDDI